METTPSVHVNIEHNQYTLILDESSGSIVNLVYGDRPLLYHDHAAQPLFSLKFRDEFGHAAAVHALEADCVTYCREERHVKFTYEQLRGYDIAAVVDIECDENSPFISWNISIENHTDLMLEWIDFPGITVPNRLVGNGGTATILWPAMEGVLVEDADVRDGSWLRYQEPGYPSKGWEGIYPGPAPTQFMAYYDENGGLYIGAHDRHMNVKSIEFYKNEEGDGIRLQFRLFAEGAGRGTYTMNYPMVLGVFQGDWHDAAAVYRTWLFNSDVPKPVKLSENPGLPQWYHDSPVVVTYPVRGIKDTGNMDPNEYFPYVNAMPHLLRLGRMFDSKIMALLMHWEGTAPWAPPYVWPPYGGTGALADFAVELHRHHHLLGLYCSGIGWTQESLLVPEYRRDRQFEEEALADVMCAAPDGTPPYSLICNGAQRWGYDMCPAHPFVQQTVLREIAGMLESDCDYIQFFDQNLGGLSYFCYSRTHGHGPGPGKWQSEAMLSLFRHINAQIRESGRHVVIGCEGAAAEPFIAELPFNDMRFNINYFIGKPVPLYQYVYHEFTNNFMGNQNSSAQSIDVHKSPDNLLWRLAYSFTAGDMFTVVLKDGGEINWDWGTAWTVPPPDQDQVIQFIANVNPWRTGAGRPYLSFGRMEKPFPAAFAEFVRMEMNAGHHLSDPAVMTSRWTAPDGSQAQVFVNYTDRPQQVRMETGQAALQLIRLIRSSGGIRFEETALGRDDIVSWEIDPLSAILVKWPV